MTAASRPSSHRLAWLLWWLTCAFTLLGLFFLGLSWSAPVPDAFAFRGHPAIWALAYAGTGQLLVRRRPQNAIGWLFLAMGLVNAVLVFGMEYPAYVVLAQPAALPGGNIAAWIASWSFVLTIGLTLFIVMLFPTGRPPSQRWRPLLYATAGAVTLLTFAYMVRPGPLDFASYLDNPFAIPNQQVGDWLLFAGNAALALCQLGAVFSIILRVRRAAGVERQQLKWFSFSGALLGIVGVMYPFAPAGSLPKLLDLLIVAGVAALPFAVLMAILRYRLYEIDRVINRTLVYALLTLVLGAIYLGSVLLLRTLFRALTGEQPEIVTVISTLVIAALFVPLRRRIQSAIDRRFYRRRYDATRTLEAFGTEVRDEVDLERLADRLVAAVEDTMEPAHVSLWLKPTDTHVVWP